MLNQTVITVRIIEVIMNSTGCITKHFSFQLNNQGKGNAMGSLIIEILTHTGNKRSLRIHIQEFLLCITKTCT